MNFGQSVFTFQSISSLFSFQGTCPEQNEMKSPVSKSESESLNSERFGRKNDQIKFSESARAKRQRKMNESVGHPTLS